MEIMPKIQIVENPSEIAAGTRGASLGIDALRIASYVKESDYFARYAINKVKDENQLLMHPTPYKNALRIDGIAKVYERVCDHVSRVLEEGDFPLVLAADHASAGGTIAGIKKAYPNKRLGVLWIDAHGDLHTPYTTPSGNVHGMPLATALNTDNLESKINEPSEETVSLWNQMKNTGGIAPKIIVDDLVFIGVRDTETPENEFMERHGIRNYKVAELREKGVKAICEAVEKQLSNCDILYVSFDVDSMDSDIVSEGTGTPVPNGLSPEEAKEIMNYFCANPKLVCTEMVEVNPCLDQKRNKMAETAFDILESFTATIENRL